MAPRRLPPLHDEPASSDSALRASNKVSEVNSVDGTDGNEVTLTVYTDDATATVANDIITDTPGSEQQIKHLHVTGVPTISHPTSDHAEEHSEAGSSISSYVPTLANWEGSIDIQPHLDRESSAKKPAIRLRESSNKAVYVRSITGKVYLWRPDGSRSVEVNKEGDQSVQEVELTGWFKHIWNLARHKINKVSTQQSEETGYVPGPSLSQLRLKREFSLMGLLCFAGLIVPTAWMFVPFGTAGSTSTSGHVQPTILYNYWLFFHKLPWTLCGYLVIHYIFYSSTQIAISIPTTALIWLVAFAADYGMQRVFFLPPYTGNDAPRPESIFEGQYQLMSGISEFIGSLVVLLLYFQLYHRKKKKEMQSKVSDAITTAPTKEFSRESTLGTTRRSRREPGVIDNLASKVADKNLLGACVLAFGFVLVALWCELLANQLLAIGSN
ncbi:hypothetical protein HDU76_007379 [Blyttiomyces sp. JEL0837]|nr:hypothetical protein HDU76_007379 [Blyttiomyces sp. JEL0837]